MESIKWSCLLDDSVKERVIEQWLWNADITMEVSSGAADLNLIIKSLFSCLEEYPHSKEIQSRSYSLLLEAHTLSDSSINVYDEGPRYTGIIESSLRNWTSHADIVSICLKYLAVAPEMMNGHGELLEFVFLVINTHCHSTRVQLPGIQILYNLLQHSAMSSAPVSEFIVRKIVGLMIYNLRFQNSDFSISKICCCALEIVVRNILPQEIEIFGDDIVVLVSQVFHRYHRIPEISSVCLIIIEKLAVAEDHLLTFCSSSDQLFQICESLRGIKCSTKYSMSISAACQLLNRSITNKTILDFILGDDVESGLHFLSDLQTHLSEHLGDLNSLCCEWGLSSSQSCEIIASAVKVLSAVDDMLQSPSGRSKRVVTSGSRAVAPRSIESEEDCTPDSNSVCISPGRNLLHLYGDHVNDDIALAENSFTGNATEGTGIVYEESTHMDDFLCQGFSKSLSTSSLPSEHEATMIIEVAQQSQHQAAVAMVRADILHKLFVDATKKMEVLIRESDALRTEISSLKNTLSSDSKDLTCAKGKGLSPSHQTEEIERKADVVSPAARLKPLVESKKIEPVKKETKMKSSADRRGEMERAEDSISMSLESAPLSDSDSEGGHPGQRGTSYSSLSATQECAPSSGGGARPGAGTGGLANNALNGSSSPSHPLADIVEERTLSLAVAGIIEALSVLTCVNSAQTRYEAALTDKARRSLLQHGRGLISPADWAKYEILGGSYYVGSDAISSVTVEELARVVLHVFRHLKEYEMTGTTGLLKQSAISLAALRIFLRDIPLFRMRDLDILIKRLGVAYMSISGFSYVFMALTIQRFHRLNFNELLLKSTELLKRYWVEVRMRQGGLMESGFKVLAEDELSRSDMSTLFLSFDKGRNALQSIFNSYLESPGYKPTGSKLDRTIRLQRMTACPCKVGDEHAFVDSPSERVKLDPAAPLSTAQYGVSLRGVAQFAMDFDLHPTILSPSLLFRIFEEVLAPSILHTGSSDLDLSGISPVRTKGSGTDDTLWNLRARGVQSPSTGKSAATSASKHGEPLLSLDQFQAVVVGVALKSSYIGYLASDVRHAEEISSPPMVRRLFIGRKEEGAPLKHAVKKLNCLLTWLNESRGKQRLTERLRSISSSVLLFKPVT